MSFTSRALRTISCGLILVSISSLTLFRSESKHNNPTAANAAPSSSPIENAQRNLDQALEQLKVADEKKTEHPAKYVDALTRMAAQAANYDFQSGRVKKTFDSPDGDKYFRLAVDFYVGNKWSHRDSDQVANMLWRDSCQRSVATFESIFKKLFEASERPLADGADIDQAGCNRRDFDLLGALIWRQEPMPFEAQKRFLEQAIAMRKATLKGNNSVLLAPLYYHLACCFAMAHDLKGAEANYFTRIALLEADPVQQAHALLDLARFYANSKMYAQADSAWKRAAKMTIEKRLAWDTHGYIDLIRIFNNRQQSTYTTPIFETLLENGDDFTFRFLDPVLSIHIDKTIRDSELDTAADLIKKRIAAAPGQGEKPGMEDWKIRLSNVYLAQGKAAESKALFDQVISDSERMSLPTADWKHARAQLTHSDMHEEAQQANTSTAAGCSDIILSSPMVIKDKIEFGKRVGVTSFNSFDDNDPTLKGISGGFMRVIPPEGDSSILCLGSVIAEQLQYAGTIYCKSSKITSTVQSLRILPVEQAIQKPDGISVPPQAKPTLRTLDGFFSIIQRLPILPVEQAIQIPDGISAPPQAKATVLTLDGQEKILERGDYVLTDLGKLTIRPQISSMPIRIFLQDSPDKNDYELELKGQALSFRQFQLWYNGNKTIRLRSASGLIYAPNAPVELGFAGGFMGVLVAKEFKTGVGSSVWLDRGAVNRNLTR
jgi:tetratricopeptide (TPR) repeat protein